ncbi:hypothetical protein [Streptomyces globosus]
MPNVGFATIQVIPSVRGIEGSCASSWRVPPMPRARRRALLRVAV